MNRVLKFLLKCIYSPSNPISRTSYEELLQKEEWKEKRLQILRRDNYTCQYCHKKGKPLHVHHKYYLKYKDGNKVLPWNYKDDALITLCEDCHKWYHSVNKPKCYTIK